MKKWSTSIFQRFSSRNCMIILSSLTMICSAEIVKSQGRLPGPSAREGNRAMDEYDRTLNRMRNDARARATNERRRSLFPQINEDFQRIQIIHNEIVRMIQPGKDLKLDRLAELTDDMKKRGVRLRENLSLPEPEKEEAKTAHADLVDENHLRNKIVALHDLVVNFVANPIFKNLGVVDATVIGDATENLNNIIDLSEELKREAKLLGKSARK